MSEPRAQRPGDPVQRFIGYALATVGALMLGLAGLCTLGFAVMGFTGGGAIDLQDLFAAILTLGGFGGIPMVVGFFVMRWGGRIVRANPPGKPGDAA